MCDKNKQVEKWTFWTSKKPREKKRLLFFGFNFSQKLRPKKNQRTFLMSKMSTSFEACFF